MRPWRWKSPSFLLFAALTLWSMATKPPTDPTAPVHFPYTDIETRYLYDEGSVVSNSHVHVAFTTSVLLPASAPIYLDYRPIASTNDLDWATWTNATAATFPRPLDFDFENAISNRWICYTTWTPGPTVHTNGIALISWQLPAVSGETNICALLNTAVYTNSAKVITQ